MDWLAYYEDRRLDPDWPWETEDDLWGELCDEGDYYDDRYDELDW